MNDMSEQMIYSSLNRIMHPVIECNIVKLGIIKKIRLQERTAIVTLAFPFVGALAKDIDVRKQIINNVKMAIENLGFKVKLNQIKMTKQEFKTFLEIEQETWKNIFGKR